MKFRDYAFGIPLTLRSPLKAKDVASRINADAGSPWWPFNFGVVGRARWGRLKLRYAHSFAEYNAKPELRGRIVQSMMGSTLELSYRGPFWALVFDVFWYGFLLIFGTVLLAGGTDPPLTGAEWIMAFLILAIMFAFPIGLHLWGTRHSEEELRELLAFLETTVQATAAPGWTTVR